MAALLVPSCDFGVAGEARAEGLDPCDPCADNLVVLQLAACALHRILQAGPLDAGSSAVLEQAAVGAAANATRSWAAFRLAAGRTPRPFAQRQSLLAPVGVFARYRSLLALAVLPQSLCNDGALLDHLVSSPATLLPPQFAALAALRTGDLEAALFAI